VNGRTIIEFTRLCSRKVFANPNDDQATVLQTRTTFRVVLARPVNELGRVTGPTRTDAYELVADGPMAQPIWASIHSQSLYLGGNYRAAALEETSVIGLAMDRLAELACSSAAWPATVTTDYTLINLGELS